MAKKVSFQLIPFLFPLSAVLTLWVDIGSYTLDLALISLVAGVAYSIYEIGFKKRAVITAILNIYLTAFMITAGVVIFFFMIQSGV